MTHNVITYRTATIRILAVALLALSAGCTASASASRQASIDTCNGKPWNWCVGYHGNGR